MDTRHVGTIGEVDYGAGARILGIYQHAAVCCSQHVVRDFCIGQHDAERAVGVGRQRIAAVSRHVRIDTVLGEGDDAVHEGTGCCRLDEEVSVVVNTLGDTCVLLCDLYVSGIRAVDGDVGRRVGELSGELTLRSAEELGHEGPAEHLLDHVDALLRLVLVDRHIEFDEVALEQAAQPSVTVFAGSELLPRPRNDRNIDHVVAVLGQVLLVVDEQRRLVLRAVDELAAVEGDDQIGQVAAGLERNRRGNVENTLLPLFNAGKDVHGHCCVGYDTPYRNGHGRLVVTHVELRGDRVGEVDLCTGILRPRLEVVAAGAGRKEACHRNDTHQ